jgi:hypothetical protein
MTTSTPATSSGFNAGAPRLTVVKGQPDAAEIAAVTAVLAALSRPPGSDGPARAHRSEWKSPARRMREPLSRGAGGWRASGLPR